MKKKNRSPIYRKPKFIDGIDVINIHCYSYDEMLEAEGKNHNPEIQFAMYKCFTDNFWRYEYFLKKANIAYKKNKAFYEKKIQKEYEEYLKEDDSIKYSFTKRNVIYEIARELAEKEAEIWLNKAFAQNENKALCTMANREIRKIKDKKNGEISKALFLLEKALEQGSLEAAGILIPIYFLGKYGVPRNAEKAETLIKRFSTKDYRLYLSNDKNYCSIKKIDRVIINNAAICKEMEKLYDKMVLLKNQLDSMIKEGKTYYKGYKIYGEINFEPENPVIIDGKEKNFCAESDWKLVFQENKPIPKKVDALALWENHNKEALYYPEVFISKVTHDFIYPKKKEIYRYKQNFIPYEMFEKASPREFCHNIELVISKYPISYEKVESAVTKYIDKKEKYSLMKRKLFGFEKRKILKIARLLLDFEIEGKDLGKKIEKDFKSFAKKDLGFLREYYFSNKVNYKFSHPFGIVTKKDIFKAYYVDNMLEIRNMELSDNWLEFFWEKPYADYHLTYLNHCLWDHCYLDTREILKMKLKRFCSCIQLDW